MNIKRVAVIGLGVLLWAAQAMASQWDEQITQWKKESINLKADQIPQLEEAAKNGDVRATYLLYLELDNSRFAYSKRSSASQLGQWSQRIADSGNPIGMYMLCNLYADGHGGLIKDASIGFKWCQKSVTFEFGRAMSTIGYMYRVGEGITENKKEALNWFLKAAKLNDPNGFDNLGVMYRDGISVQQDEFEAVKWFRKGAELNNSESIGNLGYMYETGKGVTKDYSKAVDLYRKASDLGNTWATNNLGTMYRDGKGISKDDIIAVKLFQSAADLDNIKAIINLGDMYYDGRGVNRNYQQAYTLYRKAADLNDPIGMDKLGMMNRDGVGVVQNYAEAIKWFKKGGELNDGDSIGNLAFMYFSGKGIAKNIDEAAVLFKKSADLGSPIGMINLGVNYRDGIGVSKDEKIAESWFKKAADIKSPRGMLALDLYKKAAEIVGFPYAYTAIGETFKNGLGVSKNLAEAHKYFSKAANEGDPIGAIQLAEKYRVGNGIGIDNNKSANWLVKSLQLNDKASIKFNDTGETGRQKARRELDAMLAAGEITDPDVLREVRALSKPAPKAEWVQVPQSTSDEEVTFKVIVVDSGGGIGDVSFKLNGVALNVAQGRNASVMEVADSNIRTFKFRLPPGKHDVEVIAYNAENLINWTSLKSTVTSTFKPIRKPQLHAVIVGINEYENDKLKLNFAKNDATEVAKVLNVSGEKLYDQVHVKLLNSRNTTGKVAILQAIKEAASKAETEDVFVFYVAGHGVNFEDKGYHMLTADVGQTSDKAMQERSISTKELERAIYDVPSLKKVVLLDTCQSGGGLDATKLIRNRGLEDRDMVKELNRKSGAVVLAAAESQQDAMEGYQGHGIFTFVLLEALRGKADTKGDGFVSTHQLLEYIPDRTYTLAQQAFNGKKQWPSTSGKDGFPFLKWK